MEAAHLAVVPLVVVLAALPGVLLNDDVVVNPSAMADGKAMAVDVVDSKQWKIITK